MEKKSARFKTLNEIFSNTTDDDLIDGDFEEIKTPRLAWLASKFRSLLITLSLILLFFILGVIAWKLLNASWNINLSTFTFSDFLSLVMAIFAVSLSVAFYFKATDTSNNFYDNVYKFNQDVHKILGRIESGFGAKLDHMDKNYSAISSKFDNLAARKDETEEKVKEEEEDVLVKLKEKEEIWNVLFEKAGFDAKEKEKFKNQLEEKDNELMHATGQLERLKNKLHKLENKLERGRQSPVRFDIEHPIKLTSEQRKLIDYIEMVVGPLVIAESSYSELKGVFNDHIDGFSSKAIYIMEKEGLLDDNRELTRRGWKIIRRHVVGR